MPADSFHRPAPTPRRASVRSLGHVTGGTEPRAAAPEERALIERFWERIRVFAARRLDGLGAAAAPEDVAQETLRRVLDALRSGRVHTPEALPAFVFETARNVCRHWHRSVHRQRRALERLRARLPAAGPAPDPLAGLVTDGRRGQVRRALDGLQTGDRELLRLTYYEDVGTDEIARRLEISRGAVRVRRHRALKRLAAMLEETPVGGPDTSASGRAAAGAHAPGAAPPADNGPPADAGASAAEASSGARSGKP